MLDPDYLARAIAWFEKYPNLGVAGGKIQGEFEVPPPAGSQFYLRFLALRDFGNQIHISDRKGILPWTPCGAGMVFRREAGLAYVRHRPELSKAVWGRAEDTNMALFITHEGHQSAYFPDLRVAHIIPAVRVRAEYLESLVKVSAFKCTVHEMDNGSYRAVPGWRRIAKNILRGVYAPTAAGHFRRRMERARIEGEREALRWNHSPDAPPVLAWEAFIHAMDGRIPAPAPHAIPSKSNA